MPRKRTTAADQIMQDFLDALERLRSGRPQNPQLREKVRKGKPIKINISTVAQEAGRARGLIASENCRYPTVRQHILIACEVPGTEPGNRDDVIANLRAQVATLRSQLASVRDHAASHFDQRIKAERKASKYQSLYEGLRAQLRARQDRNGEKVVALFPHDDDLLNHSTE